MHIKFKKRRSSIICFRHKIEILLVKIRKKTQEMFSLILLLLFTKFIVAVSDCDWVKIIYQKMGGDVSRIPQNCCRMAGVTCHDGHVIELRWGYQGLNGYIPPEIGHLINLRWL